MFSTADSHEEEKFTVIYTANVLFDNVSTERYNKIYGNPRRWI